MNKAKDLEKMKAYLEQLLALEVLEYHDMNWLHGNKGFRSRQKQEIMREMLIMLEVMSGQQTS
jgi:hypothetical protein